MRRSSLFLVAAMLIAFAFLALPAHATKTYAGAEADFPTVNGFPALFGTTASGTGTATQYLQAVPILVNATTGAILVDSSSAATSTPTSAWPHHRLDPTFPAQERLPTTPTRPPTPYDAG